MDDIKDSNLGIRVKNHPFGFLIYRKAMQGIPEETLFDTTTSLESKDFDRHLYFANDFLQVSTELPKGHYIYGFVINLIIY